MTQIPNGNHQLSRISNTQFAHNVGAMILDRAMLSPSANAISLFVSPDTSLATTSRSRRLKVVPRSLNGKDLLSELYLQPPPNLS